MDAMQRFNRISAVICLLLSCAPRAYAYVALGGADVLVTSKLS